MENQYKDIKSYISSFPDATQKILNQVLETIKNAAPGAEEGISYRMPAFKLKGKPLVYFAGYDNHIGFYATPSGHEEFSGELSKYKQGKGSVQFPIEQPMPLDLIRRITEFRVGEVLAKK